MKHITTMQKNLIHSKLKVKNKQLKSANNLKINADEQKPVRITFDFTVYKRTTPKVGIPFDSEKSNKLVLQCLKSKYYSSFYTLLSHFTTQSHPTYCGISSMVMILNALLIDPNRRWNGIWRWFSEDIVWCTDIKTIEKFGMNLEEFNIVSKCNNLFNILFRPDTNENDTRETLETIIKTYNNNNKREHLENKCNIHSQCLKHALHQSNTSILHQNYNKYCKNNDLHDSYSYTYRLCNLDLFEISCILTSRRSGLFTLCSYHRKALEQTGGGHFSPIALYNPYSRDILMLDIARFKYPSLWINITLAYESFYSIDAITGLSRGFMITGRYF